MKHEGRFVWKVIFWGAAAIVVIALAFFNLNNIIAWMTLNDPFQNQWAVVQLSDGEILYGHLAGVDGSTIGLGDVYSLDKVTPIPSANIVSSSTDLSLLGTAVATSTTAQPTYVPVSAAPHLYINRASVLYFKFVSADDPALPYLH